MYSSHYRLINYNSHGNELCQTGRKIKVYLKLYKYITHFFSIYFWPRGLVMCSTCNDGPFFSPISVAKGITLAESP